MSREPHILAFDSGGTSLKAALVDPDRGLASEALSAPSPQHEDVRGFARAFAELAGRLASGRAIEAVGIAIPGPFDYAEGVSRMQHKFARLEGQPLVPALAEAFAAKLVATAEHFATRISFPIFFVNDAQAFALGAWKLSGGSAERFVALTLGTGLGSGFLVSGRPAPETRELWRLPYEGGILERRVCRARIRLDYARARDGTERWAALEARLGEPELDRVLDGAGAADVHELAARADAGDQAALGALSALGRHLGRGLVLGVADFSPDVIVIGGQIARAGRHFVPALHAELDALGASALGERIALAGEETIATAALLGAARHAATCAARPPSRASPCRP
jgi:glucokinase